ncbi:tetratricopeptide repeat protein [Lutibacter flavus]|uniref:Flp pilus assembly protein TadD, contains TPR repeats n=1 Tax=Lutibacter flavus TaxID=691689 RepID=A0A238XP94_9FLAO|nr:tetratricopeptide repeat protein [Lutibacter flavus]SNR59829.1 Flp pilus assembly protein TadD, contains TPR repeats [Lutibacter flavus]
MKFLEKICFSIALIITAACFSQNMQEGFQYLETGKFDKAEVFFQKILVDYPENKTANLCYGRAVGLNGNAQKAVGIFTELLKEYPKDLEIELNYAESLLWGSQFEKAKGYYTTLVEENPTNFAALLGFANTFSNLKEYENALIYVNKALEVSVKNPNAMVSKKYIRLGYANEFVQKQNYNKALSLLNENLIDFPNDKETLLNKVNIYLMTKETANATKIYEQIATNAKDSLLALNGLALVAHIDENDKNALEISKTALLKSEIVKDTTLTKQTFERYTQALIWNRKFKEAETNIHNLLTDYGTENWILALRATLGMYRSDFKETIADYKQILKKDSLSFDGNLGSTNAYFANGEINKAYKGVFKTLGIFKNQKDAQGFLEKINKNYTPFIEEKLSYTFDNGDNVAYSTFTKITFPINTSLSFSANYEYRKTENTVSKNEAKSNNFNLELQYQFHPKIIFNAKAGISRANSYSNEYNQLLAEVFFKMKPLKLQDLEIGYKREVQNFNADLVDKEIASNNLILNYNLSTNFKFGWYTQYLYTTQTDDNERNLLFTSLYYNFLSKPAFKGGLNFQHITFKNQVPTVYFSPEKFNAVEVFIEISKNDKKLFYSLNAATGYQYIEDQPKQSTYRIQAKLGYNVSDRLITNVYGTRSNIASATAAGFTFTEVGFVLKWYLTRQPNFLKKFIK